MSDQSVTKPTNELKILKEEIDYYLIDPSQSLNALSNYHKNRRIDKYLELSQLEDVTVGKKKYIRKPFLNNQDFRVLYGIQRQIERYTADINMLNLQAQSINKRLQEHGDQLSAAELKRWSVEWNRLSKEYDALVLKLEKSTDEGREKALLYSFNITKQVFLDNYMELLDLADGLFMSIINLFDRTDSTRVKDVIAPIMNPTTEERNRTQSIIDEAKRQINRQRGIDQ